MAILSETALIEVSIEEALVMRDIQKRQGLEFKCTECGQPVRPHKSSDVTAAHFEHLDRNPNCTKSHPLPQ